MSGCNCGKKGAVIAIDGPAGVGKSSVGRAVAGKMGYKFINTGEMYRALAWKALSDNMDVGDEAKITALARAISWSFESKDGLTLKTCVNGRMMGTELLDEPVSKGSSQVAKYPGVREFMVAKQRELGAGGGIVMEGRDIGTVVFPEAEVKIYLDATPQERARRRFSQLQREKLPADYDAILAGIIKRDGNDSGRAVSPLKKAQDSIVIDTSSVSIEDVIARIMTAVNQKCSRIC